MERGMSMTGICMGALLAALGLSRANAQSCYPYWATPTVPGGFGIQPEWDGNDSLVTFDDGSGPALFAAGLITLYPGAPHMHSVARWNGRVWTLLDIGIPHGFADSGPGIAMLDDGSGPRLHAYGYYSNNPLPGETVWDLVWAGTGWLSGPPGLAAADAGPVISFDDGHGMAIYGLKLVNSETNGVVKWNGSAWDFMGTPNGGHGQIRLTMIVYNDGSGPGLYVVGGFTGLNGVTARNIAKWDGQQWAPLGTGIAMAVNGMAVYDDGRGPALYVVGAGTEAGGVAVHDIARWDGHDWSDVGGGITGCISCPDVLTATAVFDDGSGPGLYVAGYMGYAGGVRTRGIARWDGHLWSALGNGINGNDTDCFAVFDDPRGHSLFMTQSFVFGALDRGIAQWVACPNCYSNCDLSTTVPQLNVLDFMCFLNKFVARDPYADCTLDGAIDVTDFVCFMDRFAPGCGR